ncbi:MAG: transcriptional regulator [Lentisphaerae bacterium GWF2_57_35]|nr:MAG: transcriptional regulator [Lentisphaerae bacterium GWF2_57_35]
MATKKKYEYWMGFDLGGTKMMATVFDAKFKIKGFHRTKTKGHEGAKEVLARMLETIEEALGQARIQASELGAIGVGCPGPLDLDRGIILHAPNLGWRNVHLKDTLERVFHCPTTIANDVDVGTFGEYRFGAAQGARCALGVFPGTGIGGACVYEGHLLRGTIGSCMEIGHIKIQAEGRLCGCGQRGCLETTASRLAISADAAAAAYRGEAPHLLKLAGTDLRQIKSGVLARAIDEGDKVVEVIVRNAAHQLGAAMAGVVNLLAPDVVVLGGGLVEAMPEIYLQEVRSAVQSLSMKPFVKGLKVVAARLGDNAGVMGAAALAAEAAVK